MIDQAVFDDVWALLEERFGREFSKPIRDLYRKSISEKLSEDQFRKAARRIFDSSRFFPSPDDFLDAVLPSPKLAAIDEWGKVMAEVRRRDGVLRSRLTAEGRKLLDQLGYDLFALRALSARDLAFLRRQFLDLYETVERERIRTRPREAIEARSRAAIEGSR